MDHHIYMSFNIYSCIQYQILSHTLHINFSSISVRLSMFVILQQKPLPLPCNVDARYYTTIGLSERANCCGLTHLRKSSHTSENATTSSSKILRLISFFLFTYLFFNFHSFINVVIYYIIIISPSIMTKLQSVFDTDVHTSAIKNNIQFNHYKV